MQGSYGVLKSMEKIWSFFSLEKISFGLLVWKKKIIFHTCIFGMYLRNISLNIDFVLLPLC